MMLTRLTDLLGAGAAERPALTFKSSTLTYGELRRRVREAAAGFAGRGLRRGDRVVVYLEKRLETVVAMLAASAAGGVVVPVNPVFKPAQVRHVLGDCGARMLITSADRRPFLPAVELTVVVGEDDLAAHAAEDWSPPPAIDTDLAAIFYTSGSTGGPKGVMLSHRNLLAGAESVAAYLGHDADDVVLSVLPLSFDAGFSQLTTSLLAGAHLVLVNYLLPGEVARLCAVHQVTALTCVPPLWWQLVSRKWPVEATRSLRYFANTGGHLPRTTLDRLRAIFPQAKPFLMYGLTEAFRSTYLDPAEIDNRPDSIGKAIPNAEVLVVRPDGTPCAPGETGEIVHRGALVSLGYWNDPVRTAERFRPWPHSGVPGELAVWSGDLATVDDEGFITFAGRTDDMIKTSGYRVSPAEIEDVAYASGLVGEAVALGLPDEHLGHRIALVVAPVDGGLDVAVLRKHLAAELPGYQVPHEIVVLAELPRSGNGKFDRGEIRRSVVAP